MNRVENLYGFGNNTEHSGSKEGARKQVVLATLPTACYFIHNQIVAINAWDTLRDNPSLQDEEQFGKTSALINFSSHYNNMYPYMGDSIAGSVESLPNNERYNSLFLATRDGYYALDRKALRYVFVGEEALAKDDSDRQITLEEVQGWMVEHSNRPDGLIVGVTSSDIQNRTELTRIDRGFNLARYFYLNGINHRDGQWVNDITRAFFARLPDEVLKLAVYKLASGMAVLDQLTQEAAYLQTPVSQDYYPTNPLEDGEYIPPLQQLWKQAHTLVATLSDPRDPLLEGLFSETR